VGTVPVSGNAALKLAFEKRYFEQDAGLKLLTFFIDPEGLKRTVRARLDELETLLSGSHFLFATMISPEMEKARQVEIDVSHREAHSTVIPPAAPHDGETPVQIMSAHGTPMSFRVFLRDARIAGVLREDAADPFMAFQVLAQGNMLEPRTGLSTDVNIELACFIRHNCEVAILGQWA
jgi:hypothetical protein